MNNSEMFFLCLKVVTDWKVIFATAFTFMMVSIGNYTVNYRKKPPKLHKAKPKKAAPAPKPAEPKENAEEAGE